MTIKLLVFDLDGVLIDTCDYHYIALNEKRKRYGRKEDGLS